MRRYLLCWLAPALLFLFSTAGFSQVLINEDFSTASGTTPPTGWSNNDLNSSGILWAFNNPGSRTFNAPITSPAAIFDSDDQGFSGGSEDATLETPTFNASTGNLYLSFDHFFYQDNANGTATVEVFNGTVWDTVLQYTSDSPDPEHVVVSITAEAGGSANAKVRFHWTGTWDYYWIIDNVRIEGLSCPPPAALGVTAITASTADAYWTTGGASSWELEYGLSGFVPGSGTVISASNDTTALPSLSPNTSYDFYVRDICGVGDESSWVGPFTFTTECAGITSLPYNETFNSTSSNAACWSVVDVNDDGDEWSVNTSSSYVQEGDRSYTIYTDFNGGNNDDYLISPAITLSGNERLSYWYRARSASEPNDFEVLISTTGDNPADFTTQLLRDTATSTTYAQEIIDLSSYSGQVYLAFHIPSGGLDGYYLYIDNITFEAIPSCLAPTALGAANITSSSADLYWTGGGASDWNVEYGITGFGQGSGTMVNTQNDTLNIPSLSSNTSYDFYVRDSCGLGDVSSWTGPYTFTTACGALLPPQNEDFSGGVPPACWDVADGGTPATGPTGLGSAEWENKGFGNTASSGAARINLFDNTIEDWLLSPEYDLTSGGPYQVEFDFGVFEFSFGTSGSATGTLGSDDQVQLLVSSDNGVTWTSLATFDNTYVTNTGGNHETIDLSVYSGNTVKFGIWASEGTTDDAEDMDVFVDNFQVRLIPTCADPTNPGATNITDVSADLYWTESGTATSWNVEYGVSGFTLGVGTSIVASNDTTSIGSLTPATTYDYYVQSDCGSGSQSTWVGPFTFATTLCPPSNQCSYNLKLHDSWGDGWNGTEVTVYQNNVAVAVIGPEFTDLTGSPLGDTLLTTLPLCDNVTTYFVITQGSNGTPNFSEEIGLDVSNLYGVLQFKHDNNAAADQGDTIGMMVTDCTPPACANPAGLGVTNISTNSATLYWKDLVGNANDWNLEYGPGGFAQGTGTTMIATNDTVTIGSLSPQTTYEFYVMANCGAGGTSSWVGPFAFTTTCAPLAIPQLEDFSNGFPPTICWDVADDGTPATGPLSLGTSTWTEDGFANNGTTGAVKINLFLNDKRDWILTPSYDLATGGPHQVEFDFGIFTWNTSTPAALGSDDEVQILVTTDEGATWTALAVYDNSYVTASGGNHVVIDLSAYSGDTVQFGIWGNDGTVDDGPDNDIMLDNFQVRTTPACPEPFGLGAMNVTSATADVYWTQLGSTSAWNIEYGPAGFTQGAGTITSASNDTSNVNGLTPQTSYDFYVQADCGTNGVSIWVGPFTFTTGCAALNTFPWVEDFETSQTTIPTCWINETNDNSDWLFITGSIGHGSTGDHTTGSGHYATVDDSQNSANDTVNNLLTPLFDLTSLTTPQLSFWYFIGKDASLTSKLVIDVFDGTSWNRGVATIRFGQRAWLSAFVDLTPYISTNTQIRFRGVETTDFNSDISIDDVVIQEAPMCPDPFALGAINFTSSSANVFWSQIGSVSNWNIEYGPINFMQGTGTIVNVSNDTVPVSGLSPNTSYDFYVQADCGMGTTSAWIGPFTFTTACAPLLPPQLEDFSAGFLPTACWDEADDGTPATGPLSLGASSWTEDGFANNGGTGAVKINLFFNDKSDWILTPSYDLAAGGPFQVEFDFGIFAWNTANPAALGSDDEVQILVTDDAGSTWTPLAVYDNTYITSAGGNHVVLDITAYSGDTVQFGIWASEGSVDDGPDNDVMMDNFEVRATPACPEPFALGSTGITSISANVYWTQMGSASSWNIEYGPAGFLQGTGTTSTVGNDTINITGLTAQTTYDFYVQTDCGTNGTSVWVGPFTFTTLCGPLLPPQLEDFSTGLPPTICWDQADGGTPATGPSGFGVSEWYESGFANVGSTGAVAINLFNLGTEDWLLSPQYDLATGGPFQVEFDLGIYEFLSSTPGTLGSDDEVQILITNDGGATWTAIRTFDDTYVTPGVAGNHEIIDISAYSGDTVQFGIWGTEGTTDNNEDNEIFMDNFEVRPIPTCPEPSLLGTFSVTDTSAELYWTGGGAADWNIEYGPVGFALGTGTMVNSNNDTLHLNGLMPATTYEFYVRDSCGAGNVSLWEGPEEFTTDACSITSQCTYTFILSDSFGDGWNGTEVTVYQDNAPLMVLGPNFTDLTGSPLGDTLVMNVDLCDSLDTYFVITTGSNGTPLWSTEIGVEVIHPYGLTAFNYDNSASANQGDTIGMFMTSCAPPSCFPPSAGGVDAVTTTTADIYWTGGGASNWNIEFGAPGFSVGTGTYVSSTNDTTTLNGLSPTTDYEFYVRDSCGMGDVSTWVGPFAFATACAPISSFPWLEDFEISQTVIPNCWENETGDDEDWIFRSGTIGHGATGDHTTGSGYYAGVDDSQNLANDTLNNLLTPEFDLTSLVGPRLSFWYFIGNDNVLTSRMLIDVYDGTNWNMAVDTVEYDQAAWLKDSLDLTPYISSNTRIRFRAIETTDFNSDISIDDVLIEDVLAGCPLAGSDSTGIIVCDSLTSVDLSAYLGTTAGAGGTWLDADATGALSGSIFDASQVASNATYTFYYTVTDPGCPVDSATFEVFVDTCSIGIEEYKVMDITVYPNPTTGMVYIENVGAGTREMQVELYSMSGQLLRKESFSGNDRAEIDLGALAKGMYNLRITSDNGTYIQQLVRE